MKRLGVRVGRLAALRPAPPPSSVGDVDVSRLTEAQQERVAALHERTRAVGVSGLTDGELDEAIALWALLVPPVPEEGCHDDQESGSANRVCPAGG